MNIRKPEPPLGYPNVSPNAISARATQHFSVLEEPVGFPHLKSSFLDGWVSHGSTRHHGPIRFPVGIMHLSMDGVAIQIQHGGGALVTRATSYDGFVTEI